MLLKGGDIDSPPRIAHARMAKTTRGMGMKIAIVGTGYVGLVSGVCFSDFGHDVICVDHDPRKIAMLEAGEVPIYEPGLDDLIAKNTGAGRLAFTSDLASAVDGADAVFIAVGTPTRRGDGHADLRYVMAAARDIARALTGYAVIVTKSTVPVGTNRQVRQAVAEANPDAEFDVASNPEFLREGAAIDDFMRPDRVVVGVQNDRAGDVMRQIYRPLYLRDFPIMVTDLESAEMIKYASNAFLATKITFINEVSEICELIGADVHHVAKGMGLDKRIGPKFLHPGPGYGGSCFPKDTLALADIGREAGRPFDIVETVISVNERMKVRAVEKVRAARDNDLAGKTVALLGLSFKPETDDMRESASIPITETLVAEGARVRAFDPVAMDNAKKILPDGVEYCSDSYDAVTGADALVIVTEWNQFRSLDLERIKASAKGRVVVDLRNVCNPGRMAEHGFDYHGVGRAAGDFPE